MLKEAVIWAILITGIIISFAAFSTYKEKAEKGGLKGKDGAWVFCSVFSGLFCVIYLIFRFFYYLSHLPIV